MSCTLLIQACGTADDAHRPRAVAPSHDYASRSPAPRPAPPSFDRPVVRYDTIGTASWYGGKFHGRKTASGEVYNKNRLTAAHPTLPFGTWVDVTNLQNGRTVTVRVNDRGPFVNGRIIDVSRRAAKQLGFIQDGLARVGIRIHQSSRG